MEKKALTGEELAQYNQDTQEMAAITNLPSLSAAEVVPIDLLTGYWTPEQPGETKRVFFLEVRERDVLDTESGEVVQLPCAFFLEEKGPGDYQTICNGSKRLLGAFDKGNVKKHTPFEITYKGKEKNATNQFKSDHWSVKPLLIHV